jgi:hypothetical protein
MWVYQQETVQAFKNPNRPWIMHASKKIDNLNHSNWEHKQERGKRSSANPSVSTIRTIARSSPQPDFAIKCWGDLSTQVRRRPIHHFPISKWEKKMLDDLKMRDKNVGLSQNETREFWIHERGMQAWRVTPIAEPPEVKAECPFISARKEAIS